MTSNEPLCRVIRIIAGLLLVSQVTGCGPTPPAMVSVTGKVTLDGKPVTAGSITFHPDTANAFQDDHPSSLLQLDGSFQMKTYPFGKGVPPGKYKVTLAPELATRVKQPEYANTESTPWELVVTDSGISEHEFQIKSLIVK